ncbi:MAG: DMT family transporter, partial [Albidovulum sp.]
MKPVTQQKLTPRAWGLLLLLALIWGASFLSNRAALAEVGVLTTVAFRVTGAAVALWAYIGWRRLAVPRGGRALALFLAMGLLNNVIPFTLIVWGQTRVDSGLAAILNAATAIFAVVLSAGIFPDERMTARRALGVMLGFLGVVLAMGPGQLVAFDPRSLGQLAILGAALSYAAAAAFARIAARGLGPEVSAAGMLTGAAVIMVPLSLYVEGTPSLSYGAATWAALAYLAFAASALAYLLYYAVLQVAGAGNLSLVTLLIPPIAIALGVTPAIAAPGAAGHGHETFSAGEPGNPKKKSRVVQVIMREG